MSKRRTPATGGPNLPEDAKFTRIRGVMHIRHTKFGVKLRIWPRARGPVKSAAQQQTNDNFALLVKLVNEAPDMDKVAARQIAQGSGWTWRDVLSKCVTGTFWEDNGLQAAAIPFILDAICDTPGAVLYRSTDGWVCLAPATDNSVLSLSGGFPVWTADFGLPNHFTWEGLTTPNYTVDFHNTHPATDGLGDAGFRWFGIGHDGATEISLGTLYGDLGFVEWDFRYGGFWFDEESDSGVGTLNDRSFIIYQNNTPVLSALPGLSVQVGAPATGSGAAGSLNAVQLEQNGNPVVDVTGPIATTAALGLVKPDGSTIIINGAGLISAVGSGGGSTGLYGGAGLYPPLAAALTPVNFSAGAAISYGADSALFSDTTATINERAQGVALAAQSAPFRATALFKPWCQRTNYHRVGLGFYDGTKLQFIHINSQNGAPHIIVYNMSNFTTLTAGVGTTVNLSDANILIWFRVANDGTNYYFRYSLDGENWITFFSGTIAGGFLASYLTPIIVIEAFNNNTGNIYGVNIMSLRVEAAAP